MGIPAGPQRKTSPQLKKSLWHFRSDFILFCAALYGFIGNGRNSWKTQKGKTQIAMAKIKSYGHQA